MYGKSDANAIECEICRHARYRTVRRYEFHRELC